jgi:A/G-specific adenine glycosylase
VIGWRQRIIATRCRGRHLDAYRIWLSEIMLQQTQVSAVLGYYARFLERFPTLAELAAAPSEDVMALWSGLGYYTRARNLHACAKRVADEYGGVFPGEPKLLAELPGIGRSTAAAIAARSCGARAAILDGNVKRVFARVFGVDRYPGIKAVEDALWQRAEALLPEHGIERYTQGLMDLGATLCTRSSPDCPRCPLRERCVAFATGRTAELPVRKPKKTNPEKRAAMLVIVDGGCAARAARRQRDLGLSAVAAGGGRSCGRRGRRARCAGRRRALRPGRGDRGAGAAGACVHALQAAHPSAPGRAGGTYGGRWPCLVGAGRHRQCALAGAGQEAARAAGAPTLRPHCGPDNFIEHFVGSLRTRGPHGETLLALTDDAYPG